MRSCSDDELPKMHKKKQTRCASTVRFRSDSMWLFSVGTTQVEDTLYTYELLSESLHQNEYWSTLSWRLKIDNKVRVPEISIYLIEDV